MGQHRQLHAGLGADTFSGPGSLGTHRPAFFGKTLGQMELERSGLLKVASPISGHTLTVPDGSGPNHHAAIKDPITGTVLKLDGQAKIVTPVVIQPQVCCLTVLRAAGQSTWSLCGYCIMQRAAAHSSADA